MKWIDTNNLRSWATRRDCQDKLPLLVRKLIRATSSNIKKISFPAGENVLIGGWDGILEVYEETTYLPPVISVWEFGTTADVKGKADDDYDKRKLNPLGFDPKEATYIFVTPRLWTKKEEWVAEKIKEDFWKEVRVYDAQDLEEWIETAPSVGAWLAVNHLSIFPKGIQPADDFWEEWSTGIKITLLPAVVLAGRQKQIEVLLSQSALPSIIPVKASSREEATAFITAAFKNDDTISEDFFARALIVDSPDAFREIMVNDKPLYLIVRFDDDSIINRAKSKGHIVYVPLGIDNSGQWTDRIDLPPLERDEFLEALIKSGLDKEQAEKISKRSARNLSVLRRQLEFNRLVPEWSNPDNVRSVIPAMLVGRWNENIEEDRKIVEYLAGESYDTYIARLKKWLFTADAPIVQIGASWRLTSPLDAWTHAGKYCTRADLDKLREVFSEVYSKIDPKFELSAKDRRSAAWLGIKPTHSRWIREGLVQSLIIISVYGDRIAIDLSNAPGSWVDQTVATVLNSDSPDLWKSFDHELPLLAEAAPGPFLTRIEDLLKNDNGPIHLLFEEERGLFHANSYHTGLLWALENLAWMPEYLSRVSLILAKLAEIDPGGELANRPINSLHEIFKSWFPQCLAKLTDRFEALKLMVQSHKVIGNKVIKGMLPSSHRVATPTHMMRWRLSDETITRGVSHDELYKTYSMVIDLLLEQFDRTETSYCELAEMSFELNKWDREKVLDFLENKIDDVEHSTHQTWHSLRKKVGRHRSFPDANWSVPEIVLERYQQLYDRLTPSATIDQIAWVLREHWPEFIEGKDKKLSHEARAKMVHDKKVEAVKFLYDTYGIDKLLDFGGGLTGPELHTFASAVSDVVTLDDDLFKIWEGLKSDDVMNTLAQYVAEHKRRCGGSNVVFDVYHRLKANGFDTAALTNILLRLLANSEIWDFVDSNGQEAIDDYWLKLDSFYVFASVDENARAISMFMKYGRHTSALHLAHNHAEKLEGTQLIEVLMNFIGNAPEKDMRIDPYEIQHIFDELRKKDIADHNTLIRLEWLYLPLLERGYNHGNTPVLHQEMTDNPDFFIQVLEQLYKTETDDQKELDLSEEQIEQKVQMAQAAYKLFETWQTIPGVDTEGNIDEGKLRNWLDRALELAKANDRLGFAEAEIGTLFAKFPETNKKMEPEKELNWPPDILCDIIEGINSKSLFDNFRSSAYNKRGSSSRGAFDGGDREWHISKYFTTLSKLKAAKYPTIAAILQDLAKNFEQQAKFEDERAERDKLDY